MNPLCEYCGEEKFLYCGRWESHCGSDPGGQSRLCEQKARAQKAERELDEKTNEVARLREALEDIANMPEYDQDDAHRLRHKAKMALAPAPEEPNNPTK